jgi:hypothetical protein
MKIASPLRFDLVPAVYPYQLEEAILKEESAIRSTLSRMSIGSSFNKACIYQ